MIYIANYIPGVLVHKKWGDGMLFKKVSMIGESNLVTNFISLDALFFRLSHYIKEKLDLF